MAIALAGYVAALQQRAMHSQAHLAFRSLQNQVVPSIDHGTAVKLINGLGVETPAAGILARAWAAASNCTPCELEFETATAGGDNAGEIIHYRARGKRAWGNLLAIRRATQVFPGPEGRMWFWPKTNNPIRLRQVTRNELKLALGEARLVNLAVRSTQTEFKRDLQDGKYPARSGDVEHIRRKLGLSLVEFWRAAKKGSASLVECLGKIHRAKREEMRRRGMFVADYVPPAQLELFP